MRRTAHLTAALALALAAPAPVAPPAGPTPALGPTTPANPPAPGLAELGPPSASDQVEKPEAHDGPPGVDDEPPPPVRPDAPSAQVLGDARDHLDPAPYNPPPPEPEPEPEPEPARYGVGEPWASLAECESGDWIDGGAAFVEGSARWAWAKPGTEVPPWGTTIHHGGLQFHPATWEWKAPKALDDPPDHAYDATPAQQVAVAERVLAAQGWGAWPVCSGLLGLS